MLVHAIMGLEHWYQAWPWWKPGLVSEGIVIVPLLLAWPFWGFNWLWNVVNQLIGFAWAALFLLYGLWFVCHQSVLSGVGVGMIVILGIVGGRYKILRKSRVSKN